MSRFSEFLQLLEELKRSKGKVTEEKIQDNSWTSYHRVVIRVSRQMPNQLITAAQPFNHILRPILTWLSHNKPSVK